MDDRTAHFLMLVGDVCNSARVAELPVRLTLSDGTTIEGHPTPSAAEPGDEVDHTGYAEAIQIAGRSVALSDVAEAAVSRP